MNRLKELRIKQGLTQKELANIVGLTQSHYSKYERGELELGEQMIVVFSSFFNVSSDYLIRNENEDKFNVEDFDKLKTAYNLIKEIIDKITE